MKEIKLFNRCIVTDENLSAEKIKEIIELAFKRGYLISPKCYNLRVLAFLKSLPEDLNSTFYKTWTDITKRTRFELFIEQIVHYLSTYGTDFKGIPFVQNDKEREETIFSNYKVILPITKEEIGNKIQTMFDSGIALKEETINNCIDLIKELKISLNYDTIKNREVLMHVYEELDILPSDYEEMVRFLIFLFTKKTLLIKSEALINEIKFISQKRNISVESKIKDFGTEKLSSVFYRYKPIFLAMKKGNEKIINELRRLAVKNHKPKRFSFWTKVLSQTPINLKACEENLESLNTFKLVGLIQAASVREKETGILPVIIRNNKIYIKKHDFKKTNYSDLLNTVLYPELIKRLSKKACKVKLHDVIKLALPSSEKTFIGNIPFGSYVDTNKNCIIGVNWKGVDGARDIDLSMLDKNNFGKIGWNAHYSYRDKPDNIKVIYSGDITYAEPEATELLYCKNSNAPDSLIKVNLFGSPYFESNSYKFTFFFANGVNDYEVEYNKMVNESDIIFSTEMFLSCNSREKICGIFVNSKFFFVDITSASNAMISNNTEYITDHIKHFELTSDCFINLSEILQKAGFEIVTEDPDIDLSVLDKSLLIDLLS